MQRMRISQRVADILDEADIDGQHLRLKRDLDRSTYVEVDKILRAIGGKWNRNARAHVFPTDAAVAVANALRAGAVANRQQELQMFETPEPLAERMADLAGVGAGNLVLEPSAGLGRLVRPLLARKARVVAVDIDASHVEALRSLDVAGAHLSDFMHWAKQQGPVFRAAVMNPPFRRNQDIRHVFQAWQLLAPGGRLVAIVSEHGFVGGEMEAVGFRHWLQSIDATVEQLPPDTFKASGTRVNARLILAEA